MRGDEGDAGGVRGAKGTDADGAAATDAGGAALTGVRGAAFTGARDAAVTGAGGAGATGASGAGATGAGGAGAGGFVARGWRPAGRGDWSCAVIGPGEQQGYEHADAGANKTNSHRGGP